VLKRFFESIDQEDPDAPKIVSSDTSWQKDPDPLPLLILKDRSGAFANLWMDYGDGHRIPYEDTRQDIKVDDGSFLFRRSKEAEKNWEKDLLETDFIKKIVGSSHYYCPLDKVAKSLTFLLEIGWNIQDGQGNQLKKAQTVQMAFDQYDERTLRVKGKVQYAEHEADVADVLGAFNRRERFIQLAPGSIGLLPADAGQMGLQELAQEGEIVGKEIQVKKSRFGSISHLLQDTSTVSPAVQNWMEKLKQFNRIEKALPTPDFKGQLRPYQQQGLDWLNFLVEYGFHGILADDMGLGKTVQVLALLSRLPRTWPHLIVVPTSLLFNWQREIEKFLPDLPVYLHHSSQRFKTAQELGSCSLILTSYTTLRLDLSLFKEVAFYSIILDEAQVIKNAHTQIAQAVFALQGQFRLSITGTPLENHLGELWSHFRFLMPDLFDNEETFLADLQAASVDQRHLQRIKKKIAPFILRRKKEEVAPDLPARIDQTVWVEMSDSQRQVYDQFLMGVKNQLLKKVELDGLKAHRMEVLEAILRLRQICCHPLLVSSALEESAACSSAKIDRLWQDIETILEEGKKVLIYSQFTSMLKWMAKEAKVREWNFAYLDGSTANREKVVSSFQEYPSISLFFISLKAGGVGLNLTAADYVFLFDPWWNEAVEEQAINRAHRIGRQETVIAKRLLVLESIEEKMMKLKAAKKELVEDLFDTEAIPSQLTLEDLRFLLS
jgi:SNF2 family DNA or RNA helicase